MEFSVKNEKKPLTWDSLFVSLWKCVQADEAAFSWKVKFYFIIQINDVKFDVF